MDNSFFQVEDFVFKLKDFRSLSLLQISQSSLNLLSWLISLPRASESVCACVVCVWERERSFEKLAKIRVLNEKSRSIKFFHFYLYYYSCSSMHWLSYSESVHLLDVNIILKNSSIQIILIFLVLNIKVKCMQTPYTRLWLSTIPQSFTLEFLNHFVMWNIKFYPRTPLVVPQNQSNAFGPIYFWSMIVSKCNSFTMKRERESEGK